MIKVSVLYENTPGQKFDMAYYCTKHIPMVRQKLGAACKRAEIDQGLAGGSRARSRASSRRRISFSTR